MEKVETIIRLLEQEYPNAKTELVYDKNNPYQLVVCVILSAQATDAGVNKATPKLFEKYKDVTDFGGANIEELLELTKSINFYKAKSARIIQNAKYLLEKHKGVLPKTINELIKLPGLGRKSANVILQEIYGIGEGIVVDTHMLRVSKRLGIQDCDKPKDAVKVEIALMNVVPKESYTSFSRRIVLHGRYVCKAKKPLCDTCVLKNICPSAFKV